MLKGGLNMLKALKEFLKWLVLLVKPTNVEFPKQWGEEEIEKFARLKKPPLKINLVKSTNVEIRKKRKSRKDLQVDETIVERHIMDGKIITIKKAYILEVSSQPTEPAKIKRWLKVGLKAKKILRYEKDEGSFTSIVWYI